MHTVACRLPLATQGRGRQEWVSKERLASRGRGSRSPGRLRTGHGLARLCLPSQRPCPPASSPRTQHVAERMEYHNQNSPRKRVLKASEHQQGGGGGPPSSLVATSLPQRARRPYSHSLGAACSVPTRLVERCSCSTVTVLHGQQMVYRRRVYTAPPPVHAGLRGDMIPA
jgi:hypothetical protein